METIYKVIIILLLIGVLGSCKKGDWYDVKSDKSLAVPTNLKDLQALLDNARIFNTTNTVLGEVGSDGHYVNDISAAKLIGGERNSYVWAQEQDNVNVIDWISNGGYKRIYYANLILEVLAKINPTNELMKEQWNDIKGQAFFHRGATFYELSQVYAPAYEESTAEDKLGLPLRLESDINVPSVRSNLKQTYDQVIHDLMQAKDLLPIDPLYKTRPSKQAIFALLARVYLSMENYKQAFDYSELSLNGYSTLQNYSTLNTTSTSNPFIGYNKEIIFYSYMNYASPVDFNNILLDLNLYNSYNENDLRKKVFFNRNSSTNLVTYKGTYSSSGFNSCFSGLATDEIYLIRAECYARQGKIVEAMNDLNTLLKTRWTGSYTDIIAVSQEDALLKVLEERKKELIFRGLRWSDLRRLNRDPRFAITLTRTIEGKTYTLEPNSYKYTLPIPDDIIAATGMKQNPGW